MTPMQMLMVSALDPDIARLLGLLNIDVSADPAVHYDYRVEGHWLDGDRSYTVHDLSKPTTAPLDPPVLTKADTPLTYPTIAGPLMTDDHAVGLRWAPPTASPEFGQTAADGIRPVRWLRAARISASVLARRLRRRVPPLPRSSGRTPTAP